MLLENWSISYSNTEVNLYTAPETLQRCLSGEVYDHTTIPNGSHIKTSTIKGIESNKIITSTGSIYELGTPNPDYVEWCKNNAYHIPTKENPIKFSPLNLQESTRI